MRILATLLLVCISTTIVEANEQETDTKIHFVTQLSIEERRKAIMVLGPSYKHPDEETIIIVVASGFNTNGWGLNRIETYTITKSAHPAHPAIKKETTIYDLESERGWIKREAWLAEENRVAMEWLEN